MKKLALDSSLRPTSLALQQGDEILSFTLTEEEDGAEHLVSAIGQRMKAARVAFEELDEILVSAGPGPFTRLRVGLAAAHGIAVAAQKPIKSLSSFVLLASFAARAGSRENILVSQAARKNWIAFQVFNQNLEPVSPLDCCEDSQFPPALENTCAAPKTPPVPLSNRLLALAHLAQEGAKPIYPPQAPYRKVYEVV